MDKQSRPTESPAGCRFALAIAAIAAAFMLALFWPRLQGAREASRRTQCRNNLMQIGLALHAYHDEYGSLPPAVISDESGRAMHSWRVLVLPFIGEQRLYERYRFDEPWDGPNNRLLNAEMPEVYRCRSDRSLERRANAHLTRYVALKGRGTLFDEARTVTLADVTDGLGETLAVVETIGEPVHWLEPRDTEFEAFSRELKGRDPRRMHHHGGAHVLMLDGAVRFLSSTVPAETLRALSTVDGNDDVRDF